MEKLLKKVNLAFVLTDVIDTLMLDFERDSLKIGKELKYESKQRFTRMIQAGKAFRSLVKDLAKEGYSIKDADGFCDDSDYLLDLLQLIVDKAKDEDSMTRIRAMIYNL